MRLIQLADYITDTLDFATLMRFVAAALWLICWALTGSFWLGLLGMMLTVYPVGLFLMFTLPLFALLLRGMHHAISLVVAQP